MRKILALFTALVLQIIFLIIYFYFTLNIKPPVITDKSALKEKRTKLSNNFYKLGKNWLKINKYGLVEMYIEGSAFNRGVAIGSLTKELSAKQEQYFIDFIKNLVPSENYLFFLKYAVAFFNRNIDEYFSNEMKQEIYGVSLFASDKFDYIGPKYLRILSYHGAHDIGHTMQNLGFVGCTSFACWSGKTTDGNLLIGRNFDFHSGNNFSKNKIIAFYRPDNGYKFVMITWAGMTGCVSGMNTEGLTVTINAANSTIPFTTATPVSILARNILQYAKNTDEAYKIARKSRTFVAESFLIGSAKENKAVIIEKSLKNTDIYETKQDNIVCTNHFQKNKDEENTNKNSIYRYKRVSELLNSYSKLDYTGVCNILRDRKGLKNVDIPLGSEKVVNQLIAHHSVIFSPKKQLIWISTNPYQLGKYLCYDLNKIFANSNKIDKNAVLNEENLTIEQDSFLFSKEYRYFEVNRK